MIKLLLKPLLEGFLKGIGFLGAMVFAMFLIFKSFGLV